MMERLDQPQGYYAPWEKTFGRILTPFEEFVHKETAGGIVLIATAVTALILANSPLADGYRNVLDTYITLAAGSWKLGHSLQAWINDGLMALFFFVVGLEIKREILIGDLSDRRAATLPILAAIGGMVVPAVIYAAFNLGGPGARGWGIPMATDIAFAVGVLALLGSRVPKSLVTFLVALAIVDDLGAVAVIALFYTEQISVDALILAGLFLAALVVLNRAGVHSPFPYFVIATLLWLAMLKSGVHATIAGILAAWTIPSRPKIEPRIFVEKLQIIVKRFDELDDGQRTLMHDESRRGQLQALENAIHKVESPLQRLEHSMHGMVAFFVIPLFALANAGVPIELASLGGVFAQPTTLGIVFGLIAGKLIGIAGVAIVAARMGLGQLPTGCRDAHIVGAGLLAGIGFTMSIFIAELAFRSQPDQLVNAKTAILFASLLAGVAGYLWLRRLDQAR